MNCLNCKYLSKDGSHLDSDYLKDALMQETAFYTCKFPGIFREAWVFAVTKHNPQMMCAGEDHTPTNPQPLQLSLFTD